MKSICRDVKEKKAWPHEKPAMKEDVEWVDVGHNRLDNKLRT